MSANVIVVGAGVIGAATALHLSLLGAGDVLVLDRDHVGSGMSSRSSALVRMHYTFGPEVELAVRSDQMFDAWPELVGAPHCVRRTGFVRIVLPGEEPQLRANVAMQQTLGAKVELVDGATLAEMAPGLLADEVTLAAWEEHGGYGDGSVAAGDMLAAARRGGVGYRPRSAVRSLLVKGDRVIGVETDAGAELAGTVVLAAGVWSPPLLAGIGLRLPIQGELHHVAVLKHEAGLGAPVACIDSTTQTYFRPQGTRETTLVGAFTGSPIDQPDSTPRSPDPQELAELAASASRRVPSLADSGIAGGVVGVYDMTPDARPLLGMVPGLDGLVVAAGFSGMGFKISPAVGEALAELVTTGGSTRVDLGPFRPSRFDDGEPISSPFPYSDD
ncbi:MAG: NAD(P)/FAD-dependent oxidoreductase [Acidimicrobiales bacterium]